MPKTVKTQKTPSSTKSATSKKSTTQKKVSKPVNVVDVPQPQDQNNDDSVISQQRQKKNVVRLFRPYESYSKPMFEEKQVDPSEALAKFGLAWNVEKVPMFAPSTEGAYVQVPDKFVTMRTDNSRVLGVVTTKYQVSQNKDLLKCVSPLLAEKNVSIVFGGAINDGSQVFFLIRTGAGISIKGDEIRPYLFVGTSHDGSRKVHFGLTSIRMFCQNAFDNMMAQADLRISHVGSINEKLDDVSSILKMFNTSVGKFQSQLETLSKIKATDKDVEALANFIFRVKEGEKFEQLSGKKKNLITGFKQGVQKEFDSHKETAGTWYGLWNGSTAFFNHFRNRNSQERIENVMAGGGNFEMNRTYAHILGRNKIVM